jgi:hypothetical protein
MPKYKRKNKLPHHVKNVDMHMRNIIEAAKHTQASLAYRHELLLHHQRINYQNEHDRIRGMLDHTNLPDSSSQRLKDRRDNLHKLIEANLYPVRR